MIHVKRFGEYTKNFMEPGIMYSSIPYDYDGTDELVLTRLHAWKKATDNIKIIGITGPLHKETHTPGCAPTMYTELTVVYEDEV